MRSSTGTSEREPAKQASHLPTRSKRTGRVQRQGRLVELARETNRRLRRVDASRAA